MDGQFYGWMEGEMKEGKDGQIPLCIMAINHFSTPQNAHTGNKRKKTVY